MYNLRGSRVVAIEPAPTSKRRHTRGGRSRNGRRPSDLLAGPVAAVLGRMLRFPTDIALLISSMESLIAAMFHDRARLAKEWNAIVSGVIMALTNNPGRQELHPSALKGTFLLLLLHTVEVVVVVVAQQLLQQQHTAHTALRMWW